jgi:hypothetical protein
LLSILSSEPLLDRRLGSEEGWKDRRICAPRGRLSSHPSPSEIQELSITHVQHQCRHLCKIMCIPTAVVIHGGRKCAVETGRGQPSCMWLAWQGLNLNKRLIAPSALRQDSFFPLFSMVHLGPCASTRHQRETEHRNRYQSTVTPSTAKIWHLVPLESNLERRRRDPMDPMLKTKSRRHTALALLFSDYMKNRVNQSFVARRLVLTSTSIP